MNPLTLEAVKDILTETLGLGDRRTALAAGTPLYGSMPELDSLAVVQLAMAIEKEFDILIDDEDFGSELFETVGSLALYVDQRMQPASAPVLAAE
ncbi:MAG: hypothetical protein JWQ89_1900 [Devosia sp.]|uniref:acyl carrier protein n=1 Tax=Devosia sp. TaxID=1871048 RepID=UPI002637A438|nr:acyl carrier protein [Devosia sp.]MDB5540173.1 hypothetical protein [Devosia sp.]